MGFHGIIIDPADCRIIDDAYFKALQDIHLIAFEFWDRLRFRL